jgi:hypothetical protein
MAKLIPPDLERCQAETRAPHSFMTLGPRPPFVRCTAKPECIITEKKAGADGQHGSMSLCGPCFVEFCIRHDASAVTLTKLENGNG